MIRFLSLLVSIPVIILVAAFAYKNAQLINIDLFAIQLEVPVAVAMLAWLLIGFVLGLLFNLMLVLNQQRKYYQLKHKKDTLDGLSGVLTKSDK